MELVELRPDGIWRDVEPGERERLVREKRWLYVPEQRGRETQLAAARQADQINDHLTAIGDLNERIACLEDTLAECRRRFVRNGLSTAEIDAVLGGAG